MIIAENEKGGYFMNDRERFLSIARFQRTGDPFVFRHWFWYETVIRWQQEGMPAEVSPYDYVSLGKDRVEYIPVNTLTYSLRPYHNSPWPVAVDPKFERKIIEEDQNTVIIQEVDGGIVRFSKKDPTNMPQFIKYPVPDRKAWESFKIRFDPLTPTRFLPNWEVISNTDFQRDPQLQGHPWSERNFALGVSAISLFGIFRDMMGLTGISYTLYDDPKLIEEMMDHMVYFSLEIFKKIFDAGITLDFVNLWEDMCYRVGLLVSPKIVKEMMVPRYRILTDFLRNHGVNIFMLDCDGNVDELVPLLLEGGVNGIFPLEVQAGMDPVTMRKKYGKDLIIAGGIDKRELTKGKKEIDEELKKIPWLLEQGGYFPIVDHLVPPDVPLENYMYMMEQLQKMSTTG